MTLIRIVGAPDSLNQAYLDRRTKNHGYIYKVLSNLSGNDVVTAASVSTGRVITVLREHTEEIQEEP